MRSEAGTEHQESNTRKALSLHYWRVAISRFSAEHTVVSCCYESIPRVRLRACAMDDRADRRNLLQKSLNKRVASQPPDVGPLVSPRASPRILAPVGVSCQYVPLSSVASVSVDGGGDELTKLLKGEIAAIGSPGRRRTGVTSAPNSSDLSVEELCQLIATALDRDRSNTR